MRRKHLGNNGAFMYILMVYIARDDEDIVACAFLLIVEKPMSPSFITEKRELF